MDQYKKLHRSGKNKIIGGVAAGFAKYFNVDPTFVRLMFVLAGLAGPGIPFYLIAWLIMPPETNP